MTEAENTIRRSGRIGFYVAESLQKVYREIAGLLGIPFDEVMAKERLHNSEAIAEYSAILADGISLSLLKELISGSTGSHQGAPLVLVCGPVSGETRGLHVKKFAFNLGQEGTRLFMEGRDYTEKDIHEPILDWMLAEIREVLRREVKNFLELPPVPWGYAYAMTLTHDIDILSLKEMPVARTFLGYFYRSSVVNWQRWRTGKVETSEHFLTIWEMARTWAAKVGLGKDVWQRALPKLLALEKRLGVRSSLYFMPFPARPGILPEHLRQDKLKDRGSSLVKESAPANRASFYDVTKYKDLLTGLEEGGWEAGVHGIDAWHDIKSARDEYGQVAGLTRREEIGVRMHWLYFKSPDSFKVLEEGGFQYDSTFGFNEVVGFRAGTLQPYHPLNCQTLWELPLHIQDGALLAEEHFNLNREDAFHKAKPILDLAKRFGGVVSLLWHNQSFTAPRFWGEVYERLIEQGQADGAWIAVPREVLRWFGVRRQCEPVLTIEGTHWQISCPSFTVAAANQQSNSPDHAAFPNPALQIPPLRIRLHIEPHRVRSASVPYEAGTGYIDFPAQALVTLEVKGED